MFILYCTVFACLFASFIEGNGNIHTPKAVGNGVVTATVDLIENTCIFPNDYQFFRRIAFQESQFGYIMKNSKNPDAKWNGVGKGGIWQVDNYPPLYIFNHDQNYVTNNPTLNQDIMTAFGVNFPKLSYANKDLWVPLNAGIAGRVRMSILSSRVPIPISLQEQADYWKQYYNSPKGKGTPQQFLDSVATMNRLYACKSKGVDLLFILDASTSIGAGPFANALNFIAAVANDLDIGESAYKIAVDVFSDTFRHAITFNGYSDVNDLVTKIKRISYTRGGTNMREAFELAAMTSFRTANGGRDSQYGYPKVAILITDGQPNDCGQSDCFAATATAASNLKNSNVELYTVGVGPNIDADWLKNDIASVPKCLHADQLVDYEALSEYYPTQLRERACRAVAVIPKNQTVVRNSVTVNQSLHFQLMVNISAGVTLEVKMDSGKTDLYVSKTVRTPSAELYDYHTEATQDDNGQIYISPADLEQNSQAFIVLGDVDPADANNTIPVFASIIGREGNGSFVMNIDQGDTTDGVGYPKIACLVVVMCSLVHLTGV